MPWHPKTISPFISSCVITLNDCEKSLLAEKLLVPSIHGISLIRFRLKDPSLFKSTGIATFISVSDQEPTMDVSAELLSSSEEQDAYKTIVNKAITNFFISFDFVRDSQNKTIIFFFRLSHYLFKFLN